MTGKLEFPILVDGFDGPVEFLAEGLWEEFLDGDVEFLWEDDSETWVDIVLHSSLAFIQLHKSS